MELREALKHRRSVRSFKPDPIEKAVVKEILEAALQAPSAGNVQPWRFMVIQDPSRKQKLAGAALNQSWVAQAPLTVVVLADLDLASRSYGVRGVELYSIQDTAAAIQNMLLMAVSHGIYSCWVGAFSEERVSRELELSPSYRPLALIPMGYPQKIPAPPPRRPLSEVVDFE